MSEQNSMEPLPRPSSSDERLTPLRPVTMFGAWIAKVGLVSEADVIAWESEYMEQVELPLLRRSE